MSTNKNEPNELEEIIKTAFNKLVATHRIKVETNSDCFKEDEIRKLLLNLKKFSIEQFEIKDRKIEIVLFYTSDLNNTIKNGIIKIESEEEVLEAAHFCLQSACVGIEKKDIKVEQSFFPKANNNFLVLF